MPGKLLSKKVWKNAIGASQKARRLHLIADHEGFFHCPVPECDSYPFRSQRGCRKHVFQRHGWFYYFDKKPNISEVLPDRTVLTTPMKRTKRSSTADMPMFIKTCKLSRNFKQWITSPGGGGKSDNQADQLACRVLKYLKFCCDDTNSAWDIPDNVVDYCLGSVNLISD